MSVSRLRGGRTHAVRGWVSSGSSCVVFRLFRRPQFRACRRRGGQGREAPGPTLARRDGGWQVSSSDFSRALLVRGILAPWSADRTAETRPQKLLSGAGDDADGEALSAIEHQDEIVGIGGVDRLDRGVGDGIGGSAIVVLVMNRKGPPFQKIRDREPDVPCVRFDGNLVEPVRSDFPVACLALHVVLILGMSGLRRWSETDGFPESSGGSGRSGKRSTRVGSSGSSSPQTLKTRLIARLPLCWIASAR